MATTAGDLSGPQLHRQLPGARHRPHEVPVSKDAIQQFSPDLYHYISHLHIAVAGFIATPVLVLAVALPTTPTTSTP
jgi:hypothetical protein